MDYPLTDIEDVQSTKDRILLAAAMMFAEQGFSAVSLRDIAKRVNIKASSIYNHYKSKDILLDAIIDTIEQVYLDFYERLDNQIAQATSFEQVLDCLFAEVIDVYHMFIHYGVNLISAEQFRNKQASHAFNDVYMKIGIEYSFKAFNACIQKKWVKEFDAMTLATMFMNSVFVGTIMHVRQDLNYETVYDPREMFISLKRYMLSSVEILK